MSRKSAAVFLSVLLASACTKPQKIAQPAAPPGKSQQQMLEEIKLSLAKPDGCVEALPQIEELGAKYEKGSDYYYYKASCFRETNPESACVEYDQFIKIAKWDSEVEPAKVSDAREYMVTQNPLFYPRCSLMLLDL